MYIYTYTHHLQPLKAMRYSAENQPNMNRTHVLETTQCCLKQAKIKINGEMSHSRIRGLGLKMPVVPKWIHRFTTVAIKISARFFFFVFGNSKIYTKIQRNKNSLVLKKNKTGEAARLV